MNKTTGILRKSNYQQHIEPSPDLLVFGYQSKLFRDDGKALEFDRESHLIPAPYEPKDLISRYDVRATLESAPCEADDSFMNRLKFLSPAEQQAEQMAEKERYYSLYTNEVEEELYKEELMKREKTHHNQVAFNYDSIGPCEPKSTETSELDDSDTTPFTPSVKLDLPVDMKVPPTVKLNQIIEKTAKFISSQGLQMEILLKTKQAANPQFNFLNHDGLYNSYYKHILNMITAGTYPWQEKMNDKSEENSQDSEVFSLNGNQTPPPTSAIVIPKMVFKPSADCTYTQLISKITKAPISEIGKQIHHDTESSSNNGASSSSAATDIVKKPSGLMGLVHYSSDSDSEEETEAEKIVYTGVMPPSELQVVIDKTASYVAKNGADFEETLRKKKDVRFRFLDKTNEFHQYYVFQVVENGGTPSKEENLPKTPPAPVCFSIKPKEEKAALKPTILHASSDDENKDLPETPAAPQISTTVEEELEMQVDAMNSEREEKFAKEKLTDKLMSAAREKLGMLPKEKMLQIERKKKALMFINQIKGSNGNSSNGGNKEDEIINLTHYGEDSDEISVKSIPVTNSPKVGNHNHEAKRRSRSRKRSSSNRASYSSSSSSRSRSSTRSHKRSKRKKSKSHRSKKKYRKRSRSRSRSYSSHKRDRRDRRY